MEELEALVALAQAPNVSVVRRHDAFSILVVRFQDMAYGYAYALLEDHQLAQDAAQEAFIIAYQHLDQLREPRAFPGWLRQIIRTASHRLTRGKRVPVQQLERLPQLAAAHPDLSAAVESQELQAQVRAAIRALPEHQRIATMLYYIDGYSQQEVAAFLDVSVDAVKKLLQRARSRLHERMLDMLSDNLRTQRPSQDDRFVQAVQLFTSLYVAAEESQLATIELMLIDGIDIDSCNADGQTLLHWAAQHGHQDAVELLIGQGALSHREDRFGRTPLQIALEGGHTQVVELLHRQGRQGA
jgi:RNA polymerase sigma factor (sigma-70 family)